MVEDEVDAGERGFDDGCLVGIGAVVGDEDVEGLKVVRTTVGEAGVKVDAADEWGPAPFRGL